MAAPIQPTTPAGAAAAEAVAGREARRGPPVVGMCASAGGVEAFKAFFAAMPADAGIAFVLVPHLDPTHESLMVELLTRCTPMPVREALDGIPVAANHVYVLPPNHYMSIADGALRLTGPVERRGVQTSMDLFLRSLATDQQDKAICIILSGTGSHGTLGLEAVKAAGGLVMVQDPATAAHPGMPQSAVNSGLCDYVLPVDQMPATLVRYVRRYCIETAASAPSTGVAEALPEILALIRIGTHFDFRCYRKQLLIRRIERRMSMGHFERAADYVAYLRDHADEVERLHDDLLIRVTSFFRDPEAFEDLSTHVLQPLIREKAPDAPLRIWVPACATGEEAYSIAMLCLEQLKAAKQLGPLQVFATDVDEQPLEVARKGSYLESIAADVSPARLLEFFTHTSAGTYVVSKPLRTAVVIAVQNLITDAPFSKLDLIACRNLLIYLEPEVQQKLLALFHFALREGGYLMLGPSESLGRLGGLFEPVVKKWRLYRRLGPNRPDLVEFPIASPGIVTGPVRRLANGAESRPLVLADLVQRHLVEAFAPAAVLVDREAKILYYHGPTGRYLSPPVGEPTQDLVALAADGLRSRLRLALQAAAQEGASPAVADVQMKRDGSYVTVRLRVQPMTTPRAAAGLLLVTFQDLPPAAVGAPAATSPAQESLVRHLERELAALKADFHDSIEELERANEEQKTAHEEVLSMNEELQSTNEELETSREELQSLNEELSTVNSQLRDKVEALERAHDDVNNLMAAADIAIVFLDGNTCLRRFTPAMTRLLPLREADVGRPLTAFASPYTGNDLLAGVRGVLERLAPVDQEVLAGEGRCHLRRIAPYRTATGQVDGVVVTFTDITAHLAAYAESRRLAAVLRDSADAIFLLDLEGRITSWNRGAERMYGYTEAEACKLRVADLVPPDVRAQNGAELPQSHLGKPPTPSPTPRLTKSGRRLQVLVTVTALTDQHGKLMAVAETDRDVTSLVEAERELRTLNIELEQRVTERTHALRESESHLRAVLDTANDAILTTDHRGRIVSANQAAQRLFDYEQQQLLGQSIALVVPAPFGIEPTRPGDHALQGVLQEKVGVHCAAEGRRRDGSTFPMELALSTFHDHVGPMFTAIMRDVSERKAMERHLADARLEEQARIARDLHDGLGGLVMGIGMLAKTIHITLEREHSPLAVQVAALVDHVRDAEGQLRQIAQGLLPVAATPEGLSIALQRLARRHDRPEGPRCQFTGCQELAAASAILVTNLYYIAQEAVSNAVRHAQATQITIELSEDAEAITLRIRDNGLGNASAGGARGLGLQTMKYRANSIGGTLSTTSNPGAGTLVSCRVPRPAVTEA